MQLNMHNIVYEHRQAQRAFFSFIVTQFVTNALAQSFFMVHFLLAPLWTYGRSTVYMFLV